MAPLEPWEKVLVSAEYFETEHSTIACSECHGGQQSNEMETAHTGLIARPSDGNESACSECHRQSNGFMDSLHVSQAGYWSVLEERGLDPEHPASQEMFGNHCQSCHTSCGDCHVSQPGPVGGGLIDGHIFNKTPSMTRNCTACHGSRVGNEYLGKHEGLNADVHFRQGRMVCVDCHSGDQMHSIESEEIDHRYDGVQSPACTDCHANAISGESDNMSHQIHGEKLACQVCHSVSYTSCDSCHVSISENTGNPIFETGGSYLTFFIGNNYLKDETRPYDYVLLRHVPIDTESFAFYGDNLMPNFDERPTWVYTTPHNIQLNTPQTESCDFCHGNEAVFLTADKVKPEELNANNVVILEQIPE